MCRYAVDRSAWRSIEVSIGVAKSARSFLLCARRSRPKAARIRRRDADETKRFAAAFAFGKGSLEPREKGRLNAVLSRVYLGILKQKKARRKNKASCYSLLCRGCDEKRAPRFFWLAFGKESMKNPFRMGGRAEQRIDEAPRCWKRYPRAQGCVYVMEAVRYREVQQEIDATRRCLSVSQKRRFAAVGRSTTGSSAAGSSAAGSSTTGNSAVDIVPQVIVPVGIGREAPPRSA